MDMFLDYEKKQDFLDLCDHFGDHVPILLHPKRVELHCIVSYNAIKVWLHPEGAKSVVTGDNKPYLSPFVDLFVFRIESGLISEVWLDGRKKGRGVKFKVEDFYPTQPFYFGGIYLFGPRPLISELRGYKTQNCIMSMFNHRLEIGLDQFKTAFPLTPKDLCLNCRKLHNLLPFAYYDKYFREGYIRVYGSNSQQNLFPVAGNTIHPLVNTTIEQRLNWFNAAPSSAQQLTNNIQNLDSVEIDNTIAPLEGDFHGRLLNVVEFNAERGKRWLESSELLKDADVIILNEVDIGMARSDQQHTARLMAYHLGLNYAWGLEFVELTLGDAGDRQNIGQEEKNFLGLHGNAILSKFQIFNATIFRDRVGKYFSHRPNGANANGLERRLGGRMIMLARIIVNNDALVIGSTHKLGGFRGEIKQYIGSSPAIIAGDQDHRICNEVGLNVIKADENHPTWPASCDSMGGQRGDNICSNLKVAVEEYTVLPCLKQFGLNISLGDHALTGAVFELP